MKKIVAKFGGTSLADAEQFKKVKRIVQADENRRYVVVSAPGKRFPGDDKITDLLLSCADLAARGEDFSAPFDAISGRFAAIRDALALSFPIEDELAAIREKMTQTPDVDYAASRGEYLSARLLAEYLGYTFVDPAWCVSFEPNGSFNMDLTIRLIRASLLPLERAVIAGFYGADTQGRIRTFSRGGSDVTGSLVARAVEAELYENWTDVSGLLAADPRIVKEPQGVKYITYRELRTLSYMGASVLHTDAVLPASDAGIPINIRNTNRPEDAGTMIVRRIPPEIERRPVTGLAGLKGMSVIQIEKVMVSDGAGFVAVTLDILKRRGIPFEQCLTGIDTVTLVMRREILNACREELLDEITRELSPNFLGVKENLSMIAVVGEQDTRLSNANIRVLEALTNEGIEISTINQGAGKLNLLIGVPEERYESAIRAIYGAVV